MQNESSPSPGTTTPNLLQWPSSRFTNTIRSMEQKAESRWRGDVCPRLSQIPLCLCHMLRMQTQLIGESSVSRERCCWSLYFYSVCVLTRSEQSLCAFPLPACFLSTSAPMHFSRASCDQHQQQTFQLCHFSPDSSAQIFF